MSKTNNEKKIKVFIILLSIILVMLLVIFGIVYFNKTNKDLRYIYDTNVEGNIEMMPLNVAYAISDYKGGVNQRTIYKALYMLVDETIPKYSNLVSEIEQAGVSNYFKTNKIVIAKELGITAEDDFTSFISEIKQLKGENLVLKEYTFHPDAVARRSGYLENVLLIKYENNEKIGLYIRIPNQVNENIFAITCAGGVEEKYLEYEYGSELVNTDENGEVIQDVEYTSPGKVIN